MATLYSKAAGPANWSTLGTFNTAANGSGTDQVPVGGVDKVIIQLGHTVVLDGAIVAGDDTTTTTWPNGAVNINGVLKWPRTMNASLTGWGVVNVRGGGRLDMGTEADPIPMAYLAELILNKRTSQTSGMGLNQITSAGGAESVDWSFVGAYRTRNAVLDADFVAGTNVANLKAGGHNWQVGDSIVFMNTTDNSAQNQVETLTVQSISGADITFTASATYTHKAGSPACCASSNVVVRSFSETSAQSANINFSVSGAPTAGVQFTAKNALFKGLGQGGVNTGITIGGNAFAPAIFTPVIDDCAFVNEGTGQNAGMYVWTAGQRAFEFNRNFVMAGSGFNGSAAVHKNSVFCVRGTPADTTGAGRLEDCFVCFRDYNGNFSQQNFNYLRTTFCGRATSVGRTDARAARFIDCDLGKTFGWKPLFGDNFFRLTGQYQNPQISVENCKLNSTLLPMGSLAAVVNEGSGFELIYKDKDQDVTLQERYTNAATFKRDNALFYRSTSSIAIKPLTTGFDNVQTQSIPCAAGGSVRIVGYIRVDSAFYNSADWFPPTVTISGLGITPVTFTASAAANGAWEKYDVSATNNVAGYDGNFTLTFTAKAKTVVTGTVWFDGVPNSPYITKARHYGFVFDEPNPARVVNTTVQASEAAAIAYTGISVAGGSSVSPVSLAASRSFQQLYDYTQAWSCANLDKAVPMSGSGAAGSPALLALADVTIGSGHSLSGQGSIGMGGYTLASEFASAAAYTYTGGAWSQPVAVPSVNGGQLNIGAAGTYVFGATGAIVRMTPSAPGTYAMGGCSFSGTIDLRNATAHAITVQVPAGTTYTTANNTGGTITVTAPTTNQSVTVNGLVAGSRVQIYDLTNAAELYNGVVAGTSHTWNDPAPATGSRAIRLRVAKVSGATARRFVDTGIGTCGTSSGDSALSYLVNQEVDDVYGANAVDGSTVTGITIVDAVDRMQINIAGGTVSWKDIYAYNVAWLATEEGIRDDGSIITAKDVANYTLTLFKIKNTSAVPLKITEGYGVDSVTGSVADILDVTGGSIFPVVDHVVSSVITVSGASVVTGTAADIIAAMPTALANASAVRTELGTELARLDVAVSTRNATTPPTAETVAGAVLAAAAAAPIAANVEAINGTGITGGGVPGNEWGPA